MDVYQGTDLGGGKHHQSAAHCADIAASLGRVEETLKLIEVNGRGSDHEVRYKPRDDAAKVRFIFEDFFFFVHWCVFVCY